MASLNYYREHIAERRIAQRKRAHTVEYRFLSYRGQAKRRGVVFALTFEEFKKVWGKSCFYCGKQKSRNGVDRIDNKKGYERGNIVSCCGECNRMKSDLTKRAFLELCRRITLRWKPKTLAGPPAQSYTTARA